MSRSAPAGLQNPPTSPILYQNAARDIVLIDIPTSIAAAQGRSDRLLSTAPLETPIELKDDYQPKSQKNAKRDVDNAPDAVRHAEYKALIADALAQIRQHVPGAWCLPRLTKQPHSEAMDSDDPEKELESRMREWATQPQSKGDDTAFDLQKMMASLGATFESDSPAAAVTPQWTMSYAPVPSPQNSTTEPDPQDKPRTEPWSSTFHNPSHTSQHLHISQSSSPAHPYRFTIPPHSTLFLNSTTHPDDFRTAFRSVTATHALPRHFDLILLDPPWPNRSAKRKTAYENVGGMPYVTRMLRRMDIDSYLEHGALLGIWITNKAALRNHVLGPGGLFETWNVGLVEEWVWVKTTARGECMFDIDCAVRRPYEVLLLGRAAPNAWTRMAHAESIRRRVIAAVPDVHSRKPCLKEMLKTLVLDPKEYSALEVFSRYLVQGWMAWGNEVVKFNWEGYWSEE